MKLLIREKDQESINVTFVVCYLLLKGGYEWQLVGWIRSNSLLQSASFLPQRSMLKGFGIIRFQ